MGMSSHCFDSLLGILILVILEPYRCYKIPMDISLASGEEGVVDVKHMRVGKICNFPPKLPSIRWAYSYYGSLTGSRRQLIDPRWFQ